VWMGRGGGGGLWRLWGVGWGVRTGPLFAPLPSVSWPTHFLISRRMSPIRFFRDGSSLPWAAMKRRISFSRWCMARYCWCSASRSELIGGLLAVVWLGVDGAGSGIADFDCIAGCGAVNGFSSRCAIGVLSAAAAAS